MGRCEASLEKVVAVRFHLKSEFSGHMSIIIGLDIWVYSSLHHATRISIEYVIINRLYENMQEHV